MGKPSIGVFFGSRSPEHDISIITGQLIISGLHSLGYPVVPVYIDKHGDWFAGKKLGNIEFFKSPNRNFSGTEGYALDMQASQGRLALRRGGLFSKTLEIDIAFPALHGRMGEDGTIQGLFEMANVPYVGCGVLASALSMDKVLTKEYFQLHGIPTPEFVPFMRREWDAYRQKILRRIEAELRYPMFVKPARLGSSIAIERVTDRENLERAIEVALHYDDKAFVENGVEHMADITCAVLGNTGGNEDPEASLLQESAYTEGLFSYEDKYLNKGGAQLGKAKDAIIIPAQVPEAATEKMRALAVDVFKKFECSGIARADFLYDRKADEIFTTEINTLPGTLYHHLWKASGVSLDDLLARLISLAGERHRHAQEVTTTFESDILAQAGTPKAKLAPHDQ